MQQATVGYVTDCTITTDNTLNFKIHLKHKHNSWYSAWTKQCDSVRPHTLQLFWVSVNL